MSVSKRGEFSAAVVNLIWVRDRGRCARCNRTLVRERRGIDWSVHHRCPRSLGGTRRPWVGLAANGLLLCGTGTTGCHGWVESHRSDARAEGFLVSALGRVAAAAVPMAHALYGPVLLDDQGGARRVA